MCKVNPIPILHTPIIIAIDGPAAAGKGTIARFLAQKLNYALIETGLFYRALAFSFLKMPDVSPLSIVNQITLEDLKNPSLREETVANTASQISTDPKIRKLITERIRQEALALPYEGVILDGRDVGTVIFPEADLKFFITASSEIRIHRRLLEMQSKGLKTDNIMERDKRDQERKTSPLTKADDAIEIDTSNLSIEEACMKVLSLVESNHA